MPASVHPHQPRKAPLHPVTESILLGLNAACEQIDEDIDVEEDAAAMFAMHQWLKAIALRLTTLVKHSGERVNELGRRN